jgi:hypothetical protein
LEKHVVKKVCSDKKIILDQLDQIGSNFEKAILKKNTPLKKHTLKKHTLKKSMFYKTWSEKNMVFKIMVFKTMV